jgi:hypothetical protein
MEPITVGESVETGKVLERRMAERSRAVSSRIWNGFVTYSSALYPGLVFWAEVQSSLRD